MVDLIVFSVGSNRYALNIENIQRIIQAIDLTNIPSTHSFIDGMMSYEDSVIKVLNFRKVIGLPAYYEELNELFSRLKNEHKNWIEELKDSVENGVEFNRSTNPHKCELGVWLDNFNSYDDKVSEILKNLMDSHKLLHNSTNDVLSLSKDDKEDALELIKVQTRDTFNNIMRFLDVFINELDSVANSLQKLILYENDTNNFAIKVDNIEDIVHIEESLIMNSDDEHTRNEFLELEGVLDIDGVLINVIKTVAIPN